MRTTMDIDAKLLREAMRRTGTKTKTETVERALQELINASRRQQVLKMEGQGYGMTLRQFLRSRRDE